MLKLNGADFIFPAKLAPVVEPGQFQFAAAALDHSHINGQCRGLIQAGGTLRYVYDPDPVKVAAFVERYPQAKPVDSLETILDDREIQLVASAAIPSDRGPLGCRVMEAGKDYFTDKGPFTNLEQLEQARETVARTGRKYAIYYCERLHSESALAAGYLIQAGAIGRVIQMIGLGPHRLNASSRPAWFFEFAKYGGIICDIGSHQIEQFLFYANAKNATVTEAVVANYQSPAYPELEDYGHANLVADNGATCHVRLDWLVPEALRGGGDSRTLLMGTTGFIELRKSVDIARDSNGNHLYLVNGDGEQHIRFTGELGFPYFGDLILDCLNRTENAMTQEHAFTAAELCLKAQAQARRVT
jgi:predicted dehydrogenase